MTQNKKHFTQHASYPWIVILLCSLFLFYKYIMQVSPNIIGERLMQEFHLQGVGLGNLAAAFFYIYLVTQLFVGILIDKYSVRWICAFAILVSAMSVIGFGITHSFAWALFFRGLMGFGAAFATICYLKNAAIWFKPNQYAFVSGLLASAAMIGAMAGEAPIAWLVTQLGWRLTMLLVGGVGLVIMLFFTAIIRDQPVNNLLNSQRLECQRICWRDVWQVLKRRQNWLLMLYGGCTFVPVAVLGGLWGNPFLAAAYHIDQTEAAGLISLSFLGLAIGGPLLGAWSDYLGKRKTVMIGGNCLALFSLVCFIYLPMPTFGIGLMLFLFGFGVGAFMLSFAVGRETNPLSVAATVIALINSGDAILGAITEPLIGKLLDMQAHKMSHGIPLYSMQDFHWAFSILPLYLLLATLSLLLIKA